VRRAVLAILLVIATSLVGCGRDDPPDRSIAFLRVLGIPDANQKAFLDAMADKGWKEGDNLTVLDPDASEVHTDDDARAAVKGWLGDGADLIVALSTPSAMAALEVAGDTPILVFANDPVASGLLKDPDEPEGTITGMAYRTPADRTIDLASRVTDDVDTVGVLWPDDQAAKPVRDQLVDAAGDLSIKVVDETFAAPDAAGGAVDALAAAGADVVVLVNSAATTLAYDQIDAALVRDSLPSVANIISSEIATVVLAPDPLAAYAQLGRQAARLLDGTDVANVPLEDPGEYHLTVRQDVAAKVGVTLSQDLLTQADDVEGG
jgi:putative tryptophan/tyrosine transport system substrate-binding protein